MTRRRVAALAVAGPALFVALLALLHVLQSETNDTDAISDYALGDYGLLANAAFVAAGMGFAALAGTLAGRIAPSRSARAAIVLLIATAIGWILLGLANTDPEGADQTTHGLIHGIGFLLTPTLPFVAPPVGAGEIGDLEVREMLISRTFPFKALGWPALALPCGPAEHGLPASIQLVGRNGSDALVLAGGRLLETALAA
jgi:hypothetical protein